MKYIDRRPTDVAPSIIKVGDDFYVGFEETERNVFNVYFGSSHSRGLVNFMEGKITSVTPVKVFKIVLDVVLEHKSFTGGRYEFIPYGNLDGIYHRAAKRFGWTLEESTIVV